MWLEGIARGPQPRHLCQQERTFDERRLKRTCAWLSCLGLCRRSFPTLAISTPTSRTSAPIRARLPRALFLFVYRGVGIDGHRYIADAIHRGAAAVVCEETPAELNVPWARVTDGRVRLAWLHSAWYGHPSRSMTVIGVTGTDGKTTTCNLIYSILKAAGIRAGMISTVNAVIGDQTHDTGLHTTTPDSADVQRLLAQMRDAGTQAAVLETTSHGLAQHRVTGTVFDVAVVTNITHEHLDFHGSYEAYRDAKAMLFRSLMETQNPGARLPHHSDTQKTAVLNFDDSSFPFLPPFLQNAASPTASGREGRRPRNGRLSGQLGGRPS